MVASAHLGERIRGTGQFSKAFTDRLFAQTMINTIGTSILGILLGTVFAIIFALMMNEVRFNRFKKVTIGNQLDEIAWSKLISCVIVSEADFDISYDGMISELEDANMAKAEEMLTEIVKGRVKLVE